jgi:2-keto-4-pentenoate hydratase/2-oxohepta-3-ene-1,7-dioic acid hydratase in catechol pathway
MRWIRYTAAGRTSYGIVEGDRLTEVKGDPFKGYERTSSVHQLAAVKIEVPVIPQNFFCVGLNYAEHVIQAARKLGIEAKLPERPDVGYRSNNALLPHGGDVIIPADATEKVQYEGELVAIIGKNCRNVSESEALDYVLGYTIGNDVSERTWQKADRTLWRAKNSDTFKPMGPWIETDVDLDSLETRVRVNGTETTRFKTNDMIHGVALYISTISRYCTLAAGDVLWMGTDLFSPDLKSGDVVDVEITGIGVLTNRFVRAGAA